MTSKSIFILALLMMFAGVSCLANFDRAVELQRAGNYEGAIQEYEGILESGIHSPELFINLSLCYQQLGQQGLSVWSCTKCVKQYPRNRICRDLHNQLTQDIDSYRSAVETFVLLKWTNSVSIWLHPMIWAILSLLICVVAALLWMRQKRRFALYLFGALIFIIAFGLRSRTLMYGTGKSIVVGQTVDFLEGPDQDSKSIYSLEPGTLVQEIGSYESYVQVKLLNLDEGWVERQHLRALLKE